MAARRRQTTYGDHANGGNEFGHDRASWSLDGKLLIVSVNRHPESHHGYFDSEVYDSAWRTAQRAR